MIVTPRKQCPKNRESDTKEVWNLFQNTQNILRDDKRRKNSIGNSFHLS